MNAALPCITLLALLPALALAGTHREWRFRVLLDGRAIGSHVYVVDDDDGAQDVHSDARFDVRFLGFDAYRYRHDAHEQWKDGCLESLDAATDDNGKHLAVRGKRQGARFDVVANDANVDLDGCVMSFAYWNPAILGATRLLNAQTGKYADVRVEPLGVETIDVRGQATPARRYALHAPAYRIDVWYTADGQWVQLETTTTSGRQLRYVVQ
ncbi:MAG: DUF6134 family protein [Casimicrobiaceae bacterium]